MLFAMEGGVSVKSARLVNIVVGPLLFVAACCLLPEQVFSSPASRILCTQAIMRGVASLTV